MKYLILLLFLFTSFVFAKEVFKKSKSSKGKNQKDSYLVYNSDDLGGTWSLGEGDKVLIYDPDGMRKTSVYEKYIFLVSEFKKTGGNLKSKSELRIYYQIKETDTKNHTPDDPNMPSPSGGFTYITHTCKIIKITVN